MVECVPGTYEGLGSASSITKGRKKTTTAVFPLSSPGSVGLLPTLTYTPIAEKAFGTSVKMNVNHDWLSPKGTKIQLPVPECSV